MSKSNHPLTRLEFSSRVAKRAQYEAFEFTVTPAGVRVRNCSHANPEDHEYLVTITDGVPVRCQCPADEHYEGACKHRVAIAIRRPVLTAATDRAVLADGGEAPVSSEQADSAGSSTDRPDHASVEADDCEDCLDEFPCWECVRTGKRALPTD